MATWLGAILDCAERPELAEVLRAAGVEPLRVASHQHMLIECEPSMDLASSIGLAEKLSRELGTMCLGFVVQTTADVHLVEAFHRGERVRQLHYSRDDGGWLKVEGAPADWERAYFFDDAATDREDQWPDMLSDELSDEDRARYEAARAAGDASGILDLMAPSSTAAIQRVCTFFRVRGDDPDGKLVKKSVWARLFGRR